MTAGISTSNSQKQRFIGPDQTKDISSHRRLDEQRGRDGPGHHMTGEGDGTELVMRRPWTEQAPEQHRQPTGQRLLPGGAEEHPPPHNSELQTWRRSCSVPPLCPTSSIRRLKTEPLRETRLCGGAGGDVWNTVAIVVDPAKARLLTRPIWEELGTTMRW